MKFLCLVLALTAPALATDAEQDLWKAYYGKIARRYSISRTGDAPVDLSLSEQPTLVWSNPARAGDTHGAFWVWTHSGRPEAVGTIFSYKSGSRRIVAHEFHSLSAAPLKATLDGTAVWSPAAGGVKWFELPNAPDVAATRSRRLRQMRMLARQLVVTAQNEGQTDGEQQMRLLAQPLFRYETKDDDVDGALFTFVLGTDPECLLLIESTTEGKWQIAAARFTHLGFRVEHKETQLFEHVRGAESETDPTFHYVCFRNGRAPLKISVDE